MNDIDKRDGIQEIIDYALGEMGFDRRDGSFEPKSVNLAEFCRETGLSRSKARTLQKKAFVAVHGNCDGPFSGGLRDEEILDLEGHRILLCHGHRYGVKGGLGHLIASAKRQGADIALFGHTHERHEEYLPEYGLWLFNPGALSYPERGEPSFGLLTLTPTGLLFSHGELHD